jgi:dCMP deaminase
MRITRDAWAMGVAEITAQRTTCLRRAVGAVLLNDKGHVLSTGYNGVAAGMAHCNETVYVSGPPTVKHEFGDKATYPNACPGAQSPSGTNLDGCHALHAEQNALLQCRDVYAIHTAYVTTAPCITCTKLFMNTGCKRIVFKEDYPTSGSELWAKTGKIWEKYNG